MFKPLFEAMNDTLDEIMADYPNADSAGKQQLNDQLDMLNAMSDQCMEEWVAFEEKLGIFRRMKDFMDAGANPLLNDECYARGKGYFELAMYPEAIREFERVAERYAEHVSPRFYLALCHLQIRDYPDAYRYFHGLLSMTEDIRIKAVSYNAMGCIHAVGSELDKACELFQLAYQTDPSLPDPLENLSACMKMEGASLYGPADMKAGEQGLQSPPNY